MSEAPTARERAQYALFLVVFLLALLVSPFWAPPWFVWQHLRGRRPHGKGVAFLGLVSFFMTGAWLVGALIAEARGLGAVAVALAAPAVAWGAFVLLQPVVERLYRWARGPRGQTPPTG